MAPVLRPLAVSPASDGLTLDLAEPAHSTYPTHSGRLPGGQCHRDLDHTALPRPGIAAAVDCGHRVHVHCCDQVADLGTVDCCCVHHKLRVGTPRCISCKRCPQYPS